MQGNVYNDIFYIFTITNDEYSNYLAFQLTVIRDSFSIEEFDRWLNEIQHIYKLSVKV